MLLKLVNSTSISRYQALYGKKTLRVIWYKIHQFREYFLQSYTVFLLICVSTVMTCLLLHYRNRVAYLLAVLLYFVFVAFHRIYMYVCVFLFSFSLLPLVWWIKIYIYRCLRNYRLIDLVITLTFDMTLEISSMSNMELIVSNYNEFRWNTSTFLPLRLETDISGVFRIST